MRFELLRLWELSRQTVVFVTHSILEAVMLSDRVVVLSSQTGEGAAGASDWAAAPPYRGDGVFGGLPGPCPGDQGGAGTRGIDCEVYLRDLRPGA